MKRQFKFPFWLRRFFLFFTIIGPGLITASADNDAPGIATYSISGAKYGYGFLWIIVLITVGEVLVQEMAARMGAVTGKGTADLIRERFGVKTSAFAMAGLLAAREYRHDPGTVCWCRSGGRTLRNQPLYHRSLGRAFHRAHYPAREL